MEASKRTKAKKKLRSAAYKAAGTVTAAGMLLNGTVDADDLCKKLETKGILGGLPVDGGILWCCTECNSKAEIDGLVAALKEVCGKCSCCLNGAVPAGAWTCCPPATCRRRALTPPFCGLPPPTCRKSPRWTWAGITPSWPSRPTA